MHEHTHSLMLQLMEKYPRQGFYLLPYTTSGGELKYAIVFTWDGDTIHDPNLSSCGRFVQEDGYGMDPELVDRVSSHNQEYSHLITSPPLTPVAAYYH